MSASFWPQTWQQMQQQQQGSLPDTTAVEPAAAVVQPYISSHDWSQLNKQQQQQPSRGQPGDDQPPASRWHVLSCGEPVPAHAALQQQQQQHPGSTLAVLELEAGGAVMASTLAVSQALHASVAGTGAEASSALPAAAPLAAAAVDSVDDDVDLIEVQRQGHPQQQQQQQAFAASAAHKTEMNQQHNELSQHQPNPARGGSDADSDTGQAAVARAESDLVTGLSGRSGPVVVAESAAEAVCDVRADAQQLTPNGVLTPRDRAAVVAHMLQRLQVSGSE